MMTDFSPAMMETRVQSVIRPQLADLENLFYRYAPQTIGKHHRLYDTIMGRTHYRKRSMSRGGFYVAYLSPDCTGCNP